MQRMFTIVKLCLLVVTVTNVYLVTRHPLGMVNALICTMIGLGWGMLLGAFLANIERNKSGQ